MSLRDTLLKQTSSQARFRILNPIGDVARLASLPAEERNRLELIEGHMYYGVHKLIERDCRYLTLLRNPVERVLSWYSYICENPWHHHHDRIVGCGAGGLSLRDCILQRLSVELDNHMVRVLAGQQYVHLPFGETTPAMLSEARANLSSFAAVGITEKFDESLQLFIRTFGWRRARPRRANATKARVRCADIDHETLSLIQAHNELDLELYRFAQELFNQQRTAIDDGQ